MSNEFGKPGADLRLRDMSIDDVIHELTELKNDGYSKVRIAWNGGRMSCVGNILGATIEGERIAHLFPAPEDIDSISSLLRIMTALCCDKAMSGTKCEECPELLDCPHVKRFEANISNLKEEAEKENEKREKE